MVSILNKKLTFSFCIFLVLSLLVVLPPTYIRAEEGGELDKDQKPVSEGRIVIKNNTLGDSGFGVYVGNRKDEIELKNNIIKGNAEGIRLLGTKNYVYLRKNKVINNLIGVKIQDTYSSNEKGLLKMPVNLQKIIMEGNRITGNDLQNVLNLAKESGGNKNQDEKKKTKTQTKVDESSPESNSSGSKEYGSEASTEKRTGGSTAKTETSKEGLEKGSSKPSKKEEQKGDEESKRINTEEESKEQSSGRPLFEMNDILWVGGGTVGILALLFLLS